MGPLQFAYQPDIGVEDAVIYLLQRSLSHLEKAGEHHPAPASERQAAALGGGSPSHRLDPQYVRTKECQ